MLYTIANRIWNLARWIWGTLIVAVFVSVISSFALAKTTDIQQTVLATVVNWFMHPQLMQWLIISLFALFLVITLVAYLISIRGQHIPSDKALRQYLRSVKDANTGLSPTGIYSGSQAIISVNVSLEDNFIHLHAVADRPRNDLPEEQLRLLEEIRKRF